jgi:hypothetical protein
MSNDLINNTNKKTINVHLDIDYNIYKNKIKKYIFVHISLIYNMFNEEFIDNFVKLYILYKKDLLESKNKKYAKLLIDFYIYLKSVEHIDQKEYFLITIKLLNIFILIQEKLTIDLQAETDDKSIDLCQVRLVGDKYIKLINLPLLNKKISDCINQIAKENIVIEIFLLFINKKNKNSKKNIIFIGEKLSFDFFMYWNSDELYNIIIKNISISSNRLLMSIKKYKTEFKKSYNYKIHILKDIYIDQINTKLILKYKIIKNNKLFDELIKDINSINLELNNDRVI